MNNTKDILYKDILSRYTKVVWTHKIHLCQSAIYRNEKELHDTIISLLSVFVSASAFSNIFKWIPESVIVPLLALLSLALTYCTTKYKSVNLEKKSSDNERFAAIMHDLRNQYEALLVDIKSGLCDESQIRERRSVLEKLENVIYSGLVPETTEKAVEEAGKALKERQESATTEEEVKQIVSPNLQL